MKTKWIWLILAIAVVISAGILRLRNPQSIATDIEAMERLGVPTTFEELNAKRPQPRGKEDNAASDYISAQNLFDKDPFVRAAIEEIVRANHAKKSNPTAVQALEVVQPLLRKYRQGSLKPYAVGVKNLDPGGIDEMGLDNAILSAANTLSIVAQFEVIDGKPKKALDDVAVIGRMMKQRSWKYEISQFTGATSSNYSAVLVIARVIDLYPKDKETLLYAKKTLEELPPLPTLQDLIADDFPYQIRILRYAIDKPELYQTSRESPPAKGIAVNTMTSQAAAGQVIHALRKTYEDISKDPDNFSTNKKIIDDAGKNLDKLTPASQLIDNPFGLSTRPYSGFAHSLGIQLAMRRLHQTTIDELLARLEKGSFSENLAAKGKDALDPFNGKPLIYRREKDGFVLYSVGADGVDNGGTLREIKTLPKRNFGATPDVVIRVPR